MLVDASVGNLCYIDEATVGARNSRSCNTFALDGKQIIFSTIANTNLKWFFIRFSKSMMVPMNEQKRKAGDEAASSDLSPPDKKQKMPLSPSAPARSEKVGATELASAFALASLASFQSPSRTERSPPESRDAEHFDESSMASLETRSPKQEPVPITPEMRSPARSHHSKRVTFAPNIKGPTRLGPRRYSFPPRLNQGQGSRMPPGFSRSAAASRMAMPPPSPRQQQLPPVWMQPRPPSNLSSAFMSPPPLPPPMMENIAAGPDQWVCDYCNVSAFPTFQEACAHEESCRARFPPVAEQQHQQHQQHYPQSQRRYAGGASWNTPSTAIGRPAPPHMMHAGRPPVMRQPPMMHLNHRMGGAPPSPMMRSYPQQSPMHRIQCSPVAAGRMEGGKRPFIGSISIAIPESDPDWLSEANCFIRNHCVEAFSATNEDASTTSKRGRISLHQVGIRCCFCKHRSSEDKEAAAVSFPASISGIYESVKRWQRVHLDSCKDVPEDVRNKLEKLNNDNSWIPATRQYWIDSAKLLGMVDTPSGIRFSCEPNMAFLGQQGVSVREFGSGPRAASNDVPLGSSETTPAESTGALRDGEYIVFPQDTAMVPPYVYFLMRQVESCRFTEADRFVARSKGPVGYPGFQCKHCHGHAGLGKYFPVSAKSLATNSTSQNIHAHLLKCRKCPSHVKEQLVTLKEEKSKAPRLEPGWRKVFFDKIWKRLHG